jgi:hypothetical protein
MDMLQIWLWALPDVRFLAAEPWRVLQREDDRQLYIRLGR